MGPGKMGLRKLASEGKPPNLDTRIRKEWMEGGYEKTRLDTESINITAAKGKFSS